MLLYQLANHEYTEPKVLRYCGSTIQMKVLGHITIGENRYFSFADAGLIEEYNLAFLSLKEGKRA
jgi:DNA repair protein RadC